jgi:hypothetical protein
LNKRIRSVEVGIAVAPFRKEGSPIVVAIRGKRI